MTTPSKGAVSACSIFIASTTTTVWPRVTRSPTAALTTVTVPGIGEVSAPLAAAPPAASARTVSTSLTRQVSGPYASQRTPDDSAA